MYRNMLLFFFFTRTYSLIILHKIVYNYYNYINFKRIPYNLSILTQIKKLYYDILCKFKSSKCKTNKRSIEFYQNVNDLHRWFRIVNNISMCVCVCYDVLYHYEVLLFEVGTYVRYIWTILCRGYKRKIYAS